MSETKEMRVGLLGATFDTGNMGVSALAAGAIKCILNAYPHAQVFLLDYSKESSIHKLMVDDKEVHIPFVNMRFSKKFYLPNNIVVLLLIAFMVKVIPFARFRKWVIARNYWLREIDQAELFASVAGGDSFSDIYGTVRFFYTAMPQLLVLAMSKRLVLLPQTIGPFHSRLARAMSGFILKRAERVFSRDLNGLRDVKHLISGSKADKCLFCYDLAFSLAPKAPTQTDIAGLSLAIDRKRPIVGVNISGLLYAGGYTRRNMFGLRIDYKTFIRELIHFLIEYQDADVLLVPHVFVAADANASDRLESDQEVCEQVFGELSARYVGRLGLVRGLYDESEIKYVIGKCNFFIGSRMHACIAAVSQCVPAVCVAYSAKFIGVMQTLGIDSIVADARERTAPEILEVIRHAYGDREAIRRQLTAKMVEVMATVLNLFSAFPCLPGDGTNLSSRDSIVPARTV
jgi:polysaccharide pyruvyl transferase WcaK-like protein